MARTPQTETIVLLPGETRPVNVEARMLTVLSCTVASFAFAFDDDIFSPAEAGIAYPCPEGLKKVRFFDVLGAGCTIRVVFADGVCMDARYGAGILAAMAVSLAAIDLDTTAINGSVGTGNGRLSDILAELQGVATPGAQVADVTPPAVTATLFLAANNARKGFVVQAMSTNAASIFVGFTNAVTNVNKCLELQPGQGKEWSDYRGTVYVYSVLGGDVAHGGEW